MSQEHNPCYHTHLTMLKLLHYQGLVYSALTDVPN